MCRACLSPCPRFALAAALLGAALTTGGSAAAINPDGQPFDGSDFTLDLVQGPVLAGSRVVGLAGAYTPIAEGVAGYPFNPASVAHRVPWSHDWFDWELDGGFTLPTSVTGFDFDNNGDSSFSNAAAFFATGGLGLQFGEFGAGLNADWKLYQVETDKDVLNVNIVRLLLLGGYAFLDGELLGGLGVSLNNVSIERALVIGETSEDRTVADVSGPAWHGGLLWAPNYLPLRVGVAARVALPASAKPDSVPSCVKPACYQIGDDFFVPADPDTFDPNQPRGPGDGFYLPRTVSLPNEIWAGAALQLFRQFNHNWHSPHDEPSEHRRVKQEVEQAREARQIARDQKLSEAAARGQDTDAIEEKLDQQDEKLEEKEEERLDQASEIDRHRRLIPYKTMPRPKLLLSAVAKITWSTLNGVGLDSFLEHQKIERSGEWITVGPHFGAEAEVWPGYLVLRGGSYLEPTRFRQGTDRWHGTGGLDIRIPIEWSVFGLFDDDTTFRLSGAVDATVRYFGWNAGGGIWR